MRNKRLAYNTISSIIYQITAIVCGFILPRFILKFYGSEVNGLTNSITQFIQIIAFLDLGVGTVVRSTLYKPLANKDMEEISRVWISGNRFFRRIAQIFIIYISALLFIYPIVVNQKFGFMFTGTLIFSISVSSFAQYYFGIVNQLLLTADQKGYIQYNFQTITLILNTVMCAILIYFGFSIQIVKLTTSLIFLTRPLYLKWYVDKHYFINKGIFFIEEPIKQKWSGLAQHLAAVVLDTTDTIVLSVFATLSDVSIYSVYFLVIHGVKQLLQIITNSIQASMGELFAKGELDELRDTFSWIEWAIHTATIFIFGCTGVLIVPFVMIYTSGVTDINYEVPIFAALMTMAHATHCLRLPYHSMILAAGHYKQTQNNYIIAMLLNIIISILAVRSWGLIGVALGTFIAMAYQTVWMVIYNSRNLLNRSFIIFIKQIFADIAVVLLGIGLTKNLSLEEVSYLTWMVMAMKAAIIWILVILILNVIIYKEKISKLAQIFFRK